MAGKSVARMKTKKKELIHVVVTVDDEVVLDRLVERVEFTRAAPTPIYSVDHGQPIAYITDGGFSLHADGPQTIEDAWGMRP